MGIAWCFRTKSLGRTPLRLRREGRQRKVVFKLVVDEHRLPTMQRHQLVAFLKTGPVPTNATHSGPSLPLRAADIPAPWVLSKQVTWPGLLWPQSPDTILLAPFPGAPRSSSLRPHCLDLTWAPELTACVNVNFNQGSHVSDPHNPYV